MGGTSFTLAMALAAAMLAVWLDMRLGDVRPEEPMQRVMHAGLSLVALFAATGLLSLVYGIPQGLFMVVVLTVFLPALVYSMLAGIWMMRVLADMTGLAGR
jgi:hypothetical protein